MIEASTQCPNVDFTGADLEDASLCANLSEANLTDVNLSGADLSQSNLSGARIIDADLSDADLRANLIGATITGTNLDARSLRHDAHERHGRRLGLRDHGHDRYDGDDACERVRSGGDVVRRR